MFLEKQVETAAPLPGLGSSLSESSYWVQEATLGAGRQAVIHLGECQLCDEGRKTGGQNKDRWYGPFTSLTSAREISDELTDVAMRAECRCVRKNAQDLPAMALLNEPLFRKPGDSLDRKAKEAKEKEEREEKRKLARAAAAKAKARKAKRAKLPAYIAIGVAAVATVAIALFVFPALSVVEAHGRATAAPFLLANDSPLTLSDVHAECSVELQPAAVHLQNIHQQLADNLGSRNQVSIPCFQSSGGAVPQVNGTTVLVTVRYAVFGIKHVQQTFSFVAAHTADGYSKWVLKG